MKFFIIMIWGCAIILFGIDGSACTIGTTRTVFSKSFPASNSALMLTEQCFEVTVYAEHEDVSFSSALALRVYLAWGISWKEIPVWSTWQLTKFGLPPRPATDSLYTLMLRQNGHQEAVWNIKILNTDLSVGVPPAPFFVDDVFYQNNTVWIFYWKKPSYYLDRQEKQLGKWVNTASLRFDRPYQLGVHFSIFLDRDKIGVKSTAMNGAEKYWRVEREQFVLQEVR